MDIQAEQVSVPQAPVAPPEYSPAPGLPPAYVPVIDQPAISAARRPRPAWILPAAIAVAGLIASGALGYLSYSTSAKLDATRHELTSTQLDLDGKNKWLAAERAQAAYVRMYDRDLGTLSTDFGVLTECDSAASCNSAAQAMLADAQSFQSDRQSAKVPASLAGVDGMLGDGLTAEVAALQDLVTAINGGNTDRIQNGFTAVNDATISVFKTQTELARLVQ